MSIVSVCRHIGWRALEGGQSEWGFEFGFGCNFLLVWVFDEIWNYYWNNVLCRTHSKIVCLWSLRVLDDNGLPVLKRGLIFLSLCLDLLFLEFCGFVWAINYADAFFVSDGVQPIIGEQPTFERGSFWLTVLFFFPLLLAWERYFIVIWAMFFCMQTRPHIRLYVVCKFSEGEWAAYERGFP